MCQNCRKYDENGFECEMCSVLLRDEDYEIEKIDTEEDE